jgi:trehalose 6-phosphate synthase
VVARVNERWGTRDWTPVLLDERDDFPRSIAAMQRYDVLLVNPIKDGLNLVAKEGPAVNRRDGLLCLSREAGVFEELHAAAIPIHPYDLEAAASALDRAIATPLDERAAIATKLRTLATARTPADWVADLVANAV